MELKFRIKSNQVRLLTVVTDEVAVVVLALEVSPALVGALPHWVGAPEI